ncbi:MAG: hypothetical protein E7638_08120 [Ruminococcaceae bacterium]|nr:hypothetical protein [Oscillospiraceae bacterium]
MKYKAKILLTAAVMLLSLSASACSAPLMKLTYTDDRFISKKEGLTYNYTSLSYEPVSVGDAYASCAEPRLTLYEIPGLDPEKWLTEEYSGAATTVLYSDSITLPTLGELDPGKMFVCLTGDRVFSIATVEDEATIDSIIAAFETGEETDWPLLTPTLTYSLKFLSEKNLPHIYFSLVYGEFPEGSFLYDRAADRCVEVGSLISDIVA